MTHPVTKRIRDSHNILSEAMVRALRAAAEGDTRLNYTPQQGWRSIQGKSVKNTTLNALERRGYFAPVGKPRRSIRPRKLTQKARDYLALLT